MINLNDLYVKPGEQPSARKQNRLVDLAAGRLDPLRTGAPTIYSHRASDTIMVKNDSGVALARFDAVVIGAPVVTASANDKQFMAQPAFKIRKATEDDVFMKRWCVLQEPLPVDGFGVAVVSGLTVANVNVRSANDTMVQIVNNSTVPVSGTAGTAELVGTYSSGTQKAWIRLGCATVWPWLVVTDSDGYPSANNYTVSVYLNADGGTAIQTSVAAFNQIERGNTGSSGSYQSGWKLEATSDTPSKLWKVEDLSTCLPSRRWKTEAREMKSSTPTYFFSAMMTPVVGDCED